MESSIMDFIGQDLIGVISPVSICMILVVFLVYTLTPSTPGQFEVRTVANLVYDENASDSTFQKLEGAFLNAFVFVIFIAVATFFLVLIYYYNCTNCLKNYMRFSTFFVLGSLGGPIFLSIIEHFSVPVDSITCFIMLFNFTIVGVLSIFGDGFPLVLTQFYMVALGIITAAWFTKLPEWTTWFLLVALALYDLVAVLAPGGPLKMLVELASSRDQDLPALVYESRPTVTQNIGNQRTSLALLVGGVSDSGSIELQSVSDVRNQNEHIERSPLVSTTSTREVEIMEEEMSPLVDLSRSENRVEESRMGSDGGIKLGLGDFIFYSVLVGRAAMYDLMTVYACYLAIICGLGCTLILLSVCRRALPALPISIALGVLFYFLTRLLMEPFVVGISTNLVMF